MASIRPFNLLKVYRSIEQSIGRYSFEFVICGPYPLPPELNDFKNVKYIRDYGSPARAAQIALCNCVGEVVTLSADDGFYTPGSIEKTLDEFHSYKRAPPVCLATKYSQGGNIGDYDFYRMKKHVPFTTMQYIPDIPVCLVTFMRREVIEQIGGFDASQYNLTCWGNHDMVIRLEHRRAIFPMLDILLMETEWVPAIEGNYGDHAPIHHAHSVDWEKCVAMYNDDVYHSNAARSVRMDNWKQAPAVWPFRFGDSVVDEDIL